MKIIYNKLVRDNIINNIYKDNKEANYRILSDSEYEVELHKKLNEEYNEYLKDHSIEELIDLEEVIRALVRQKGYTLEEFEEMRYEKCKRNGAFKEKIYLMDVIEDNKNED